MVEAEAELQDKVKVVEQEPRSKAVQAGINLAARQPRGEV